MQLATHCIQTDTIEPLRMPQSSLPNSEQNETQKTEKLSTLQQHTETETKSPKHREMTDFCTIKAVIQ